VRSSAGRREPRSRFVRPLPARELAESVLGRREVGEVTTSLGFYQMAGRLEHTADPAATRGRAAGRRPAGGRGGRSARAVAPGPRAGRGRRGAPGPRGPAPGAPGEAAYQARQQRRAAWQAEQPKERRHLMEPDVIERAHVVTNDPWPSTALTKAVSVAAESHVVMPQLRPAIAQEVTAEAERLQVAMAARAEEQRGQQAARAREAAYERGAQAEATRGGRPGGGASGRGRRAAGGQPQPTPTPEAERGGAER